MGPQLETEGRFLLSSAVRPEGVSLRHSPTLGLALPLFLLCAGCSHAQKAKGGVDGLKAAAERFHQLVRWGDLRSALQLVTPEQRLEALKDVLDRKDDDNLKVLDYELEDARIDGSRAMVLSKISWQRLPSMSVKTDAVTFEFIDRDGVWYIDSIEGGPLPVAAKKHPGPAPGPGAGEG